MKMNVTVSEQNLARITRKVESGRYSSTDDVLGSALTLLDERDKATEKELAETREGVSRGAKEADEGRVVPAREVFGELRQRNAAIGRPSE